jgi:DNA-binding transcriptional ArsR family regulator
MGQVGPLGLVKAFIAELCVKDGEFREADVAFPAVLTRVTGFERRKVLRVMDRLCREGDLRLVAEEKVRTPRGEMGPARRNPTWRVVRDPRLRRDNQVHSRVTCRDKVWSTLRGLRPRAVTVSEISRLSGCDDETVREAIKLLEEHGYVKNRGKIEREKAWVLVKDAGPKRPETPEARPETLEAQS